MPIFLNKNLNAIPVYNVDADGNIVSGGGGSGTPSQVTGTSASGAADDGSNPVKVAGVYRATMPNLANNARSELQIGPRGELRVAPAGPAFTGVDGVANSALTLTYQAGAHESAGIVTIANHVFNGTGWDRQRGDVNGTHTQGNVAAGSTDAGNPVKMGGVYNPAGRLVASGQRSDVQMGAYGSMKMQLMVPDGQTPINATSNDADATNGANALSTSSFNRVWNGTAWDRQRGDITGTWVHAPASSVANLSGTIAASGGTAEVIFANTARQEIINPSTSVLWARWGGNPTVNGSGSFPIAPGGTYSADRVGGTIVLLSTAANQPYTVYRFL